MLEIDLNNTLALTKQVQALLLPPRKRKRFNRRLANEVVRTSRQRIKEQRTLHGGPMKRRKRGKEKVLRKLMKNMRLSAYPDKAYVTWQDTRAGKVATAHQYGDIDKVTARDMQRRHGTPDYSAPASAAQAKALLNEGYRLSSGKFKGGKKKGQTKSKRVSKKWIQENMTVGQAGMVLRLLRERDSKQQWIIETPARPFFGLLKKDIQTLANSIVDDIKYDVKRRK